jgi:hypothetical protein
MDGLKKYWERAEKEERERRWRREFQEAFDQQMERLRATNFSPWFILAVGLLLLVFFLRFTYGYIQALKTGPRAAPAPAAQGHPPQNNSRRTRSSK